MKESGLRTSDPLDPSTSELTGAATRPEPRMSAFAAHSGMDPDRAYWTVYDYYMMEREARALGRAQAYAAAVRCARAMYRIAEAAIRHARSILTTKPQRWTTSA